MPAAARPGARVRRQPARSLDLQKLVHEDLEANWDAYPRQRRWNLDKPDPNIDHRRVPNLMTWFQRAGYRLEPSGDAAAYLPGDIVAWDLGRGILHIGIISDQKTGAGTPLVVHNIGAGAREEDILFRYTIIGLYRLPARVVNNWPRTPPRPAWAPTASVGSMGGGRPALTVRLATLTARLTISG